MRATWVDSGNDPNFDLLARHGITWVYLPLSDPAADVRRRLATIKARGLRGGVYTAWNWYPTLDGAGYAQKTHDLLQAAVPDATPAWPKVQLDDEEHDPQRILTMLRRWRELRPKTDTSWTLESMQGGWMSPAFAAEVVSRKVRVVPQCYNGAMTEQRDALACVRDLTKRGFPDTLVTPFYDAAHLQAYWQGWAFTQGRLP